MKKVIFTAVSFVSLCFCPVLADEIDNYMVNDMKMQSHINNIGYKILNANKIDKRMVFLYKTKQDKIKTEPGLTKRQIISYKDFIQHADNDDEIAALLAPEICKSAESYSGPVRGFVSSVQIKFASKKYEMLFDKRAVDFLVTAGYNPIALITFMNKAYVQKRFDMISSHNLTSKRLANIYEYIYFQYPQFLAENKYLYNESYQNFLLNSIENRKKLNDKIKQGSKGRIKYE